MTYNTNDARKYMEHLNDEQAAQWARRANQVLQQKITAGKVKDTPLARHLIAMDVSVELEKQWKSR